MTGEWVLYLTTEQQKSLTPLGKAKRFQDLCGRKSFPAQHLTALVRVGLTETTAGAHGLVSNEYGTQTSKGRLISKIRFGRVPSSELPSYVGIDIERGNFGIFTKEGMKKYEREELLYEIPFQFTNDSFEGLEKACLLANFMSQVEEYEAEYGEPYDTPQDNDSEYVKDLLKDAPVFRQTATDELAQIRTSKKIYAYRELLSVSYF